MPYADMYATRTHVSGFSNNHSLPLTAYSLTEKECMCFWSQLDLLNLFILYWKQNQQHAREFAANDTIPLTILSG